MDQYDRSAPSRAEGYGSPADVRRLCLPSPDGRGGREATWSGPFAARVLARDSGILIWWHRLQPVCLSIFQEARAKACATQIRNQNSIIARSAPNNLPLLLVRRLA